MSGRKLTCLALLWLLPWVIYAAVMVWLAWTLPI
jgi:hypothetical protein